MEEQVYIVQAGHHYYPTDDDIQAVFSNAGEAERYADVLQTQTTPYGTPMYDWVTVQDWVVRDE